jgi:hypothetical protein
VAGIEIFDRGFVDLEFRGCENLGLDRLADRVEVAGGGVGPGVECLPPDVHVMSSSETLGLAVVREVVGEFVGDDLGGERGGAQRAGDAGQRGGRDERRAGLVALVFELLADGAPPDQRGFDDVELVVMLLADFHEVIGVGFDFVGDDHAFDDHLEVFGETLSLGAAGFCGAWFFPLRCGCLAIALVRRGGGFSQHQLVEHQLELGGVELFGTRAEEPVPQALDDLVLALDLGVGQREQLAGFA